MFFSLEPEVAGGLGKNTILDSSTHPPLVSKLHYEIDGWLGDELLESFPCFIVTDSLRNVLESANATGFEFDSVEVTTSEEFKELFPDVQIPKFWWLKITGKTEVDDFSFSSDNTLVISKNIFKTMKQNCMLEHCDIV